MPRIIAFLLAFVVITYGAWPYYTLYRLDTALGMSDPVALAPFVDLPAIQGHYQERIGDSLSGMLPQGGREGERVIGWLAENLRQLGQVALDQTITLDWVRNRLRDAASRSTDKRPAYFMAGINAAFFESWNRFGVRLGPPDNATHVSMALEGFSWRIVDITD